MKQILLPVTLFCLLMTTPTYAKGGHGGGHGGGGHSHSHSGGGAHPSAPHSGGGQSHSTSTHAGNAKHNNTRTIITRSTSPRVIATNHAHSLPTMHGNSGTTAVRGSDPIGYVNTGYNYYPNFGNPYFYNEYMSMWWFGTSFMYSPSYYPMGGPSNYSNYNNNEEELSKEPMDGYVVFYNDTLSGAVTIKKHALALETTDSGKNYDYKFHEKDPGVQYVTVYNEDDKQLNLVRLKTDPKKLLRVVHTGKLNIYDGRRGFIYTPEDIDIKTLVVSWKGELASLHSSSVNTAKEWLTGYVNEAYGFNLDPKAFGWKELLIYIDKLD